MIYAHTHYAKTPFPELNVTPEEEEAMAAIQAAHDTNEALKEAVNHPRHYNAHPAGIECIDVAEHFGFNLGNVIKYLWRAEEKGAPLQDLEKAAWYLDREIERRKAT